MEAKPPYSSEYEQHGYQLKAYFFEPDVLDFYRDNPNYHFEATRFSTKDPLPEGVEVSGIQQYVWGKKADGLPCVVALVPHLRMLSAADQQRWALRQIPEEQARGARIDSRYKDPMLHGRFPTRISCLDAVYVYAYEIQKLYAPDKFFPGLPPEKPDFLTPLTPNTERAFCRWCQDLYTILDGSTGTLGSRITSEEKVDVIARQRKGDLLRLYTKERGVWNAEIEDYLLLLKELNRHRVASAHKIIPGGKMDQDYLDLQRRLAFGLQSSLRALLLACAQAERGDTAIIPKRVLEYDVEH